MALAFTDYDAVVLTEGIQNLGTAEPKLLAGRVFTGGGSHMTGNIEYGKITMRANVSRYRRTGEGAAPVQLIEGDLKSVRAPKIRLSKTWDETNASVNNPGLSSYMRKNTDPNANLAAQIDLDQMHLRDMVYNDIEVQCAQALALGVITLNFDDGTTDTIDFGYTSGATLDKNIQTALSGGDTWDNATVNPIKTLESHARGIRRYTQYGGLYDVYMGYDAWDALQNNATIMAKLDNQNVNLGNMSLAQQADFKGRLGAFSLYVVEWGYFDISGTFVPALDSKTIVTVPSTSNGFTIEYGAVWDAMSESERAGWIQTDYFSKFYTEGDPPNTSLIVESRPLALIKNPDLVRVQTVLA